MNLMIPEKKLINLTYETAEKTKKEIIWQGLDRITLAQAVSSFLETLKKNTAQVYGWAFERIFLFRFLDPKITLKEFSLINLDAKLDQIKQGMTGSESSKQVRAATFVSFTSFLQRNTEGMIKKALPNKEKGKKTFQKIRDKTTCRSLSSKELGDFLKELRGVSVRNYLIGSMQVQGAKRISEVLDSRIEAIDWSLGNITFKQKKSDILEKVIVVFFPVYFMEDLKIYLGERKKGFIFITFTGKQMRRDDVRQIYASAYKKAGISCRSITQTLRVTAITTLSKQGFRAEEIVKLSGHADLNMVAYYDKLDLKINPSSKVNLI